MLFEWDEDKNKINLQKHDLPLKAGVPVFDDANAIEFEDSRFDYGENRYILVGYDNRTKLLYVVYTIKSGNVTRLISVRKAVKSERRLYESRGY
jgi:uncharacterized DUF497 family protein